MKALIEVSGVIAARAAQKYLEVHGLKADSGALAKCLRSWIKIKLPEALADAKEALACNMPKVAGTTFAASMVEAGIEAAKEASQLPGTCVRMLVMPGGGVWTQPGYKVEEQE